ncbi:MAG: PIN domain-containing protein [Desulfobacteraceae bacterium]|nr:PIN domain-containing protein [Desulfobacteraceae bacterium]
MRLVVDTNIFFSGFNPRSYYYPIIEGIYSKKYRLLVSTSVLLEYEEILQKQRHLLKNLSFQNRDNTLK